MKIQSLKKTRYINVYLAALIINVIAAMFPLLFKGVLPPIVPLLYGRPGGEAQLVGALWLLIAPALALTITVINFFLSSLVKDDFLKKVYSVTSIIVSVFSLITVIKIVFLVGFF